MLISPAKKEVEFSKNSDWSNKHADFANNDCDLEPEWWYMKHYGGYEKPLSSHRIPKGATLRKHPREGALLSHRSHIVTLVQGLGYLGYWTPIGHLLDTSPTQRSSKIQCFEAVLPKRLADPAPWPLGAPHGEWRGDGFWQFLTGLRIQVWNGRCGRQVDHPILHCRILNQHHARGPMRHYHYSCCLFVVPTWCCIIEDTNPKTCCMPHTSRGKLPKGGLRECPYPTDVPASHVSLREGEGQAFEHSSPDWWFQVFLIFASVKWNAKRLMKPRCPKTTTKCHQPVGGYPTGKSSCDALVRVLIPVPGGRTAKSHRFFAISWIFMVHQCIINVHHENLRNIGRFFLDQSLQQMLDVPFVPFLIYLPFFQT